MVYSQLSSRPFLFSWTSGVELNYTKRGNVFYYVYKRFFLIFVTFLRFVTFLNFYLNVFYIYDGSSRKERNISFRRHQ